MSRLKHKIVCGDNIEIMKGMKSESVDLVVTSPPYDNLRDYNGYSFNFENTAKELFRVIKEGGVIVWIVGDRIKNGSETLIPFHQGIYFKKIGFRVHDIMIYQKDVMPFPESNRYNQCFEYMFVFSKGRPNTFNPIKEQTKGYKSSKTSTTRNKDGSVSRLKYKQGKRERNRFNLWFYNVGYMKSTDYKDAFKHPAIFPEKLAYDHIFSWSNENNIVLDPFLGSGTTSVAAERLGRNSIGIEMSKEYCKLSYERLLNEVRQCKMDREQSIIERVGF